MASIIQWNCQAVRSKNDELLSLIDVQKPCAVALQETKLWHTKFSIPNYTLYKKDGHFDHSPHVGVAILVHQSVPANLLTFNTEHQGIAVRINLMSIALCSIYISHSQLFSYQSLHDLFSQLPPPIIIMGDFISYSQLWGCETTDVREGQLYQ